MKKKLNRVLFSGLSLSLLFLLTGCVSRDSNGNPTGTIWYILGEPMAKLIQYFANNVGLGFGLAIILVTIIVRCIILPLGLYQSWKASYQSEKMAYLKPIFEPINERMRNATTQEEKLAAQTELMAAQKKMASICLVVWDVSHFSSKCHSSQQCILLRNTHKVSLKVLS